MLLCLDIGNTHLVGGVFDKNQLLLQFRYDSKQIGTSDSLGIFIRSVLLENNINYKLIDEVSIASVVPFIDYTIRATCIKYLNNINPLFLTAETITNIVINVKNPNEVGADLIASAVAARDLFPDKHLLIFDLGTATSGCYISNKGYFNGVSIAPGAKLMMTSLHSSTAKLMSVNIIKPYNVIGKDTLTAIQSGVYYSQLGLLEKITELTILENNIDKNELIIIVTGGFSYLFTDNPLFKNVIPELILLGLKKIIEFNRN